MDLYNIKNCRSREGCPKAVGDTKSLQEKMEAVLEETGFTEKRQAQLGVGAKQHHSFRIGLAGCANCCSQPQIRDFALVAKALPVINRETCILCGECITCCKEQALSIVNGQLQLNKELCLGCGDCVRACPVGAIETKEVTWRLLLGGKLGRHPQLAKEIKEVTPEDGIDFLKQSIIKILNSPNPHERIANTLLNGK
jgi:anaerobic sulfite reductase subunit C